MKIDIVVIKQAVKDKKLKVFIKNKNIYIKDIGSGECVVVGDVKDGEEE